MDSDPRLSGDCARSHLGCQYARAEKCTFQRAVAVYATSAKSGRFAHRKQTFDCVCRLVASRDIAGRCVYRPSSCVPL